jgi:hypothetical protein
MRRMADSRDRPCRPSGPRGRRFKSCLPDTLTARRLRSFRRRAVSFSGSVVRFAPALLDVRARGRETLSGGDRLDSITRLGEVAKVVLEVGGALGLLYVGGRVLVGWWNGLRLGRHCRALLARCPNGPVVVRIQPEDLEAARCGERRGLLRTARSFERTNIASPSSLSSRTFTLATSNLGQRLSSTGDVRGALAAAPRAFPWTVSMGALAWSGRAQVMRHRCLTGRPRTTLASGRHLFRAQSVDSGRCGSSSWWRTRVCPRSS